MITILGRTVSNYFPILKFVSFGSISGGFTFPTVGKFLDKVSSYLFQHAQYAEAESLINRGIVIEEKAYGPEHPNVANWLTSLALLYRKQGKYEEAEQLYQRAISMQEKAFGSE